MAASKSKVFDWKRTCSRCDGTGDDPEDGGCVCDICEGDGEENFSATEEEALEHYPGAVKIKD